MVDLPALDRRVQRMPRRRSEVPAMQVPEHPAGADVRRLVRAVACVHGLLALEQEQTRARAFVALRQP